MSRDDVDMLKQLISSEPGMKHLRSNLNKLLFAAEANKSDKVLIYLLEINIFGVPKDEEESQPKADAAAENEAVHIYRLPLNYGNCVIISLRTRLLSHSVKLFFDSTDTGEQILALGNGVSPLERAICCGDLETVKKMLEDDAIQEFDIQQSIKAQQCGNESIYSIASVDN